MFLRRHFEHGRRWLMIGARDGAGDVQRSLVENDGGDDARRSTCERRSPQFNIYNVIGLLSLSIYIYILNNNEKFDE